jgi:hypothetical protein
MLGVAKDRAAPFSRKHRRYWIPVTGGMILIGVINIIIGLTIYHPQNDRPERLPLVLPGRDAGSPDAAGTISTGKVPAEVMNAFTRRYPRVMPLSARVDSPSAPPLGDVYTIYFMRDGARVGASYRSDGTFVAEPSSPVDREW